MKSTFDFSTTRPQNPDIVQIRLIPENDAEKKLLDDNKDFETIELYYHDVVNKNGYVLLEVIDESQWPHGAQLSVQKVVGLG